MSRVSKFSLAMIFVVGALVAACEPNAPHDASASIEFEQDTTFSDSEVGNSQQAVSATFVTRCVKYCQTGGYPCAFWADKLFCGVKVAEVCKCFTPPPAELGYGCTQAGLTAAVRSTSTQSP